MSNIENLKHFEKGKSGNPAGRPKGSKNRSTIIREMLDMMVQVKDDEGNDVGAIHTNIEQLPSLPRI